MIRDSAALLKAADNVDKLVNRDTSARQRAVSQYVASSMRAYAELAQGDTASATRLFDALADTLAINIPFDLFTRARLIGRQDPRRAIAILERHGGADLLYPARELERGARRKNWRQGARRRRLCVRRHGLAERRRPGRSATPRRKRATR